MKNKLYIGIVLLLGLIVFYLVNLNQQKSYRSSSSVFFDFDVAQIKKIIIQSNDDALEISRGDTLWSLSGHDSLKLKTNLINTFFERIKKLESERIMTEKSDNWLKYNIDDSLGVHLALIGWDGNTIEYFVFGRSNSDYSRCYARKIQSPDVHLLNQNIIHILQPNPNYWGEKPKEIIPLPENQ